MTGDRRIEIHHGREYVVEGPDWHDAATPTATAPVDAEADYAARAIAEARARADAAIADAEALRAGTVALRAELDEARAMLRAIDDAVGGVRGGETLVDAVRRVVRDRDALRKFYDAWMSAAIGADARNEEAKMGDGMGHANECVTSTIGEVPSEAEEHARALDRDGFHGDARAVRAHELGVAEGERRASKKVDRLRTELTATVEALARREEEIGAVRVHVGAKDGEALVDAIKRVRRESADYASKRVVAERDAAYQRGQEEMRSRAAIDVDAPRTRFVTTGELAARVCAIPIAKTPTAPASEDAGEAVRRRATEAAGAGDSVARESASAQDTCDEPNEDARVDYGSTSWIPTCAERAGHEGDHVARGMNGASAIRWPRTCAREDATCDVSGDAQAEIVRLRSHEREVAEWRAATECQTPAQARQAKTHLRSVIDGDRMQLEQRLSEIDSLKSKLGKARRDAERDAEAWRTATGADSPDASRHRIDRFEADLALARENRAHFAEVASERREKLQETARRVPQMGDIVNLVTLSGVDPAVVLDVYQDGSLSLRNLRTLDCPDMVTQHHGNLAEGWRFRD